MFNPVQTHGTFHIATNNNVKISIVFIEGSKIIIYKKNVFLCGTDVIDIDVGRIGPSREKK